jgi:hypothetical protein
MMYAVYRCVHFAEWFFVGMVLFLPIREAALHGASDTAALVGS